MSACTLYFEKLESLAYIFVLVCVYLYSNLCIGLQKTHLFCTRVRHGCLWSFRVIQGRWFWCQSKARMRLPISWSLWLWSYLASFLRYGDLLAKKCLFFLPLCHSVPSLPMFPLEFCGEVKHEETRVMVLSFTEDRMCVPYTLSRFDTVPACDGRTEWRIYYS